MIILVLNVTYFLAISKNNENLLREYFFAKDGILIFDVFPEDSNQVQVFGEQQYDHNYVMSDVTPLQVVFFLQMGFTPLILN